MQQGVAGRGTVCPDLMAKAPVNETACQGDRAAGAKDVRLFPGKMEQGHNPGPAGRIGIGILVHTHAFALACQCGRNEQRFFKKAADYGQIGLVHLASVFCSPKGSPCLCVQGTGDNA